jgi:hypothetical protein
MQVTEQTPAGWYPDPANTGQQRYWDGTAWTDQFAPGAAPNVPSTAAAKKPFYKRTWFIVLAVLVGLGVIGNVIGGPPSTSSKPEPSATKSAAPAAEPQPEPAPAVAKPAEPELTMGQKQALSKGEDYIGIMAFSRSGLIKQLAFDGFSEADATFAVDKIAPDWNEQAAKKAKDYIGVMSFSRSGLIKQLVFDGFTQAQAEYGTKAAGY